MYDDGTHGDAVSGDRIYTNVYTFGPDSANGRNLVGQEFKFGINGGDNEGGKGGFGNNHIENINDANATATVASQFGSINPLYYDQWNFGTGTKGVGRKNDGIPGKFALEQNYPNPFNPTTTINYSIPLNGLVSLKVFNILGQEVMSLVNTEQTAGNYQVTFNANTLSSGVYFYRIDAGSFSSVKKMMLMK
ncbi:MAG: T9SS type A sorting domain-containing protein [Ignavibacteriales bacterium]|nr:T9SS type A sorting domain-containing protein [Ignavibacteriales bacterium]